jgi:acetyl-CoA synthetase
VSTPKDACAAVRAARDVLLEHRLDHEAACREFRWPRLERFNFARDWFDRVDDGANRVALRIVEEDGGAQSWTYAALSENSRRVANFLRAQGLRRGDAVLVMLGADVALWEVLLACTRLGARIIPATTLLSADEIDDRMARGAVRVVIAAADCIPRFPAGERSWTAIVVGGDAPGWLPYEGALKASAAFEDEDARGDDPLLLYFTSGTTARPKMVVHTHTSYPVGHLSTLYWIGLQPGDVHLNISSPGWAKHAWSSVFGPWLAEATVLAVNQRRFDPRITLDLITRERVTTFCAPPTVWRMLIQEDLRAWRTSLRELTSAGEPLNGEVISHVQSAWGLTIRDGFGQTETTALIGNSPGLQVKAGSVGRPLPGYDVAIAGAADGPAEGEIMVLRSSSPVGLMKGYVGDANPAESAHRTGDIAARDEDGYITFIGRSDDVFKSSDYRISPFELESVLIEHPEVVEAAVVPSPDPLRLSVPKAFVSLAPGRTADAALARSIFEHSRNRLAPFKRLRRLEVFELPKTISGKIRRVELRNLEADRRMRQERGPSEWLETDFPDLARR